MTTLTEARRLSLRFLVSLYILMFFELGYFWAGRGHRFKETLDLQTSLDNAIPLVSFFIVFYFLGYLFVFAPSFSIRDNRKFAAAVAVFTGIMILSFAIFKLMPVGFDKPRVTGSDIFSRLVAFQHGIDSKYNHFPSLHVSLNVYALLVIGANHGKKIMLRLSPLVLLVIASTMLVKQHLIADVIGGAAAGYIGYRCYRWLSARPEKTVYSFFAISMSLVAAFAWYQSHKLQKIIIILSRYLDALGA